MNKTELVAVVAQSTGFTKKDTEVLVNETMAAIEAELVAGGKIQLMGFGTFEVRKRNARVGRNPRNPEETIDIPASNAPVFKAGKAFKEAVNK